MYGLNKCVLKNVKTNFFGSKNLFIQKNWSNFGRQNSSKKILDLKLFGQKKIRSKEFLVKKNLQKKICQKKNFVSKTLGKINFCQTKCQSKKTLSLCGVGWWSGGKIYYCRPVRLGLWETFHNKPGGKIFHNKDCRKPS